MGDSSAKAGVIPHEPSLLGKALNWAPKDKPASYQLVGEVMAYQGDDG